LNKRINQVLAAEASGKPGLRMLTDVVRNKNGAFTSQWQTMIETWLDNNLEELVEKVTTGALKAPCIKVMCSGRSHCVGTDKIGHFFQQGHMIYQISSTMGNLRAIAFSKWSEGLMTDDDLENLLPAEDREWLTETGSVDFTAWPYESKIPAFKEKWGGIPIAGIDFAERSTADHAANLAGSSFWSKYYKGNYHPPGGPFPFHGGKGNKFDICDFVAKEWEDPKCGLSFPFNTPFD